MSNVTLQIGGRSYLVACAAGEERRVEELGQMIENKATLVGSGHNEVRLLLFAALLLADELHDLHEARGHSSGDSASSDLLEQLATRLEKCASALEG